jgi:hypothetical protein
MHMSVLRVFPCSAIADNGHWQWQLGGGHLMVTGQHREGEEARNSSEYGGKV